MLLTSTTVNGAVSNDSNNNITMSVGNTVIANVNSSGIFFESGKKAIYTGAVLQVVQATLAGTQAVSGASAWTDVTSLSAAITPTSSTSKILVSFVVNCDGENNLYFRIMRGSTAIGVGNADGVKQQVSAGNGYVPSNSNGTTMMVNQFLDSPATTSSTTYKIQAYCDSSAGSGTYYINYASGDGNNVYSSRCMSTLTLMEIAV